MTKLSDSCSFNHDGIHNSGYGENVFVGSESCLQAIDFWFSEKIDSDVENPGFSPITGHYILV